MICEPRWGWGARAICIGSSLGKESQKNTCSLERFFFLVDLGPRAVVGNMRIEINTGHSCYLSAARRRRGRFFLLLDLGPGAAAGGMGLEINTVYSCYLSNCGRI